MKNLQMKIIYNKNKLIKLIQNDNNLGFVPTMGGIHSGHSSLIKKSLNQCKKTIVSIFINKPQFNKTADFNKYPRVNRRDIFILKKLKINYLYLPTEKQVYPEGYDKKVVINAFSKKLCGKNRKGHFEAVVNVINNFINIIKPSRIYFGEKDMQQFKIVQDFIKKKHPKIKVVSCKTIREKNGVALSSRNIHLSKEDMKKASNIFKFLFKNKKKLIKKRPLIKQIKKKLLELGARKIDYIEVLNINKIVKPFKKKRNIKIFIAYYIGSTRLIDNF